MATWDDVRSVVVTLPETDEQPSYGGLPGWRVRGKQFCWERPLSGRDRRDLGEERVREVDGPTLGVRVADQEEKAALVGEGPPFFTVPHFDGWPGLLLQLDLIGVARLQEVVTDAWFCVAPAELADSWDLELVVSGARSGLPSAIGAPAVRALQAAGFRQLDDLVGVPEKSLLAIHGVGPKAARILSEVLQRRG